MSSTRLSISIVFSIVLCLICSSCGNTRKSTDGLEGKIIYDLTYPYEPNSVMMDLYPKEMVVYFKEDKIHSEIRSSYDLLTTDFIVDHEDRTFTQLLKNVSKRSGMTLNEEETKTWYKKYPEYAFEHTEETSIICGLVCTKTIARALNTELPPVEIYHTRGLGLSCSNWWNPFNGVDGFLMAYDVEQYGMCMRLKAREIIFEQVEDTHFGIPANYEMTSPEELDKKLSAVVEEYIK